MSDEEYKKVFSKKLKHYLGMTNKSQIDLVNDLKLSQSTVSNWCTGLKLPRMNKIQMLADYFGIEKSDLLDEKVNHADSELTKKDEKDIARELDDIMSKIRSGEDGPMRYNGEEIDEDSLNLLESAINMTLRDLKKENKIKYNPYKNKR